MEHYIHSKRHLLIGLCLWLVHPLLGQTTATATTTITADAGRPLAKLLEQIEHRFLQPISFEEAPFENSSDLASSAVRASNRSDVALSMTLGPTDTTPAAAAASALVAYENYGLPGSYKIVQTGSSISMVPTQVMGVDGKLRDVVPMMSTKISFPSTGRTGSDTLQIIADALSQANQSKVLLLNQPFRFGERVTTGASGEAVQDVIQKVADAISRPMSYQCLYDVTSKTYYLNVKIVAPDPIPGSTIKPMPIPRPSVGPSNSPWFQKWP